MGIKEPERYVINTNGRIANAFEINKRESYVFITSYLMSILNHDEIVGVLAHEEIGKLKELVKEHTNVTFVYSARNVEHNSAVALKNIVEF